VPSFALAPMRRRHVKSILAIEERVYPKPWTAGVFNSEIDLARRDERHYVVGLLETEVVAYGGLMFAVDEAHITNIAVDPEFQRRGFARRVLLELANVAIDRGFTALTLEVRVSNTAAQAMYRRFGFAPAGIRQRYYENTEDALVMWAHDIDSPEYRARLDAIAEVTS
jgi:ribosomal-protein-alanine N-acetyltransferase